MAARRKGLTGDYLGDVLGGEPKKPKGKGKPPPQPPTTPARVRATFYLDVDLYEHFRNAAVFLAGPPTHASLSSLVEEALRRELVRLEKAHRSGEPFPPRSVDLRGRKPRGRE